MKQVLVIYEDSVVRRETFGPHRLMMAFVADALQVEGVRREEVVGAFRPFPKNGADKVVDMLCGDPPTEASETARGAAVVALLDSDRLREMVNRRFKCSTSDVEAARLELEKRANELTQPAFVRLIDNNVEWVCQELIRLQPTLVSPVVAADALRHDRASRDELLGRASEAGQTELRAQLLEVAPLLRGARDCLVERLREVRTAVLSGR